MQTKTQKKNRVELNVNTMKQFRLKSEAPASRDGSQ